MGRRYNVSDTGRNTALKDNLKKKIDEIAARSGAFLFMLSLVFGKLGSNQASKQPPWAVSLFAYGCPLQCLPAWLVKCPRSLHQYFFDMAFQQSRSLIVLFASLPFSQTANPI